MLDFQLLVDRLMTMLVSAQRRAYTMVSGHPSTRPAQLLTSGTKESRQALRPSALPLLGFAVACVIGYMYWTVSPHPVPIWPPYAILLSALLLTSPTWWWLYILVSFPIRIVPALAPGTPMLLLITNWLNEVLTALVAAVLVRRFAPRPFRFTTLRAMGVYLASAVFLVPILPAFAGAASYVPLDVPFWWAVKTWFLQYALATLVLTPTIVIWVTAGLTGLRPSSRQRALEAFCLGAALVVVGGLLIFTQLELVIENGLYYLPLPLLVWAAVRFGPRGVATALTAVTCFALADLAGLWGLVTPSSTPRQVLSLQLFLIATAVPLLLLAAQIEERKQAVEALRGSEVRFRASFESAGTGMMLVNPTGRILQANQRLVQMLGYSEVELCTYTFLELTHPEDLEPNLLLLQKALAGDIDRYQMHTRYLHKAGNLVWTRVTAGMVRDDAGHPLYLVDQLEDITVQKGLEQEREEARASELALRETKAQMDTFLGIASHELKTPLTSLKLSLQWSQRQLRKLIQSTPGPPGPGGTGVQAAMEQLERTAHQMNRMEDLVNDLVDVSRIQAGKLELRPELVDLVVIVREAILGQREAEPYRGIYLEQPDDLSMPVYADAGRIEQVVTNFLTNALKYSLADRPVEVGIEVEPEQVRVWVRDYGPGVPVSEQKHIWERFHRAQGVEVQSGAGVGLGLGLFISRMIVEHHQGQVGVESTPDQGATFWFTLPLSSPSEGNR
jgi:PAS domain S-box-containing protein